MEGLDLANRLVDPGSRAALEQDVGFSGLRWPPGTMDRFAMNRPGPNPPFPDARYFPLRTFRSHPISNRTRSSYREELLGWINEQMLFGRHLGLRGNVRRAAERGDENTYA